MGTHLEAVLVISSAEFADDGSEGVVSGSSCIDIHCNNYLRLFCWSHVVNAAKLEGPITRMRSD